MPSCDHTPGVCKITVRKRGGGWVKCRDRMPDPGRVVPIVYSSGRTFAHRINASWWREHGSGDLIDASTVTDWFDLPDAETKG